MWYSTSKNNRGTCGKSPRAASSRTIRRTVTRQGHVFGASPSQWIPIRSGQMQWTRLSERTNEPFGRSLRLMPMRRERKTT